MGSGGRSRRRADRQTERGRECVRSRLHLFTFRVKLKGNSALFKSGFYVDVPGV